MRDRDGHHHQDQGGGAVGPLADSGAAAMSRPFGRKPYGRAAAARSAGPHPHIGGTRRHAAPMTAPAKTGPGPSSVAGILLPRKTIGTYRKDGANRGAPHNLFTSSATGRVGLHLPGQILRLSASTRGWFAALRSAAPLSFTIESAKVYVRCNSHKNKHANKEN